MNAPFRKIWTQEEFFAWEGHGEGRYEFDGFEPVAMTGGSFGHNLIMHRIYRSLDRALGDGACQLAGPDSGVATIGKTVRYPDALITCARVPLAALTTPGVVAVFEVVSPGSSYTDRIVKVREYAAVPTIGRYVIVESTFAGLTVFERQDGSAGWSAGTLGLSEMLGIPEAGIEVPVASFYDGIDFSDA